MLQRQIAALVSARLRAFPAVVVVGPRQCGKTTFAKSLLPRRQGERRARYFDLEQPEERVRLDVSWAEVMSDDEVVVFDEAQADPSLFPRLRGAIDQRRSRKGRFLLLGSVAPALMTRVSESLAGRLSVVEMGPLSFLELPGGAARERLWLTGGFPDGGVRSPRAFPQWQRDYLMLLAQRDLPAWGLPSTPQTTERFFRMLAAVHGQAWNASGLGRSLGLTYHTVNAYLDRLEGAFLIRRLPSFHANIGKRLVKAPKVYWRDSGLLHALLGVRTVDDLLAQPWVGASWEGFVIEQVIAARMQRGEPPNAHFFRTSDGREIDLLIDVDGQRWAIEVKLTSSPSEADLRALDQTADLVAADRRILISRVADVADGGRRVSANLPWLLEQLGRYAPRTR